MPTLSQRFRKAWNVFTNRSPTVDYRYAEGTSYRPDRLRYSYGVSKTLASVIYTKISVDCRSIDVKHVETDQNGRFKLEEPSYLDQCLTIDANIDQTGRDLIQDIVQSMLDEGVVAVVPVIQDGKDIYSLRTGRIVQWYPSQVKIDLYDERDGRHKEVLCNKGDVAIIPNPHYQIMNEPSAAMKRYVHKLSLLDSVDENSYGKIDILFQVPYSVKSPTKKAYAEERLKDITRQMSGSRYGIAYYDATEKITQLNRSLDNHLVDQINKLQEDIYAQLGLNAEVFNGTANEEQMLNYYNRTIEPIMSAIVEEMTRKFLTPNARTRGQRIMFFRDPFKLVPINSIADIADKFTRNAILSSNEIRGLVGFKPVEDPKADELVNNNLNQTEDQENPSTEEKGDGQNVVNSLLG